MSNVNEKIQKTYDGVVAALRAAGATVCETEQPDQVPNKRLDKVNGEYAGMVIEETQTGSIWHRRGTGKVKLTVRTGYSRGELQTYPETKAGLPNVEKAAVKLLELVQESKNKRDYERRKENRAQEALKLRGELAESYDKVEYSYSFDYGHCLKGGPEQFRLELANLSAEQVADLLKYAAAQGIVQKKVQNENES